MSINLSWTVMTHIRRHHHWKKLDLLVDCQDQLKDLQDQLKDKQLYQSDQDRQIRLTSNNPALWKLVSKSY